MLLKTKYVVMFYGRLMFSMFGSTFIKLILNIIDFVRIDLYLVVPLKMILTESKKNLLLPESILKTKIDSDSR